MMNKNWQLKCVKAFYDITGELDEYKENIWEQHVHALYVGDYPWFPAQFHVHYRLCRCDHVFSILLLSVPTRAGDSSFGTRYL